MRLSKLFIALLTVGLLSGVGAPTRAATTNLGGFPQGTLVTSNVQVPSGGSTVVFTVPDDQVFVLTTWCSSNAARLVGSSLGLLPLTKGPGSSPRPCIGFAPGIVIPKGEVLRCENSTGGPQPCLVSGILVDQKRKRFLFR